MNRKRSRHVNGAFSAAGLEFDFTRSCGSAKKRLNFVSLLPSSWWLLQFHRRKIENKVYMNYLFWLSCRKVSSELLCWRGEKNEKYVFCICPDKKNWNTEQTFQKCSNAKLLLMHISKLTGFVHLSSIYSQRSQQFLIVYEAMFRGAERFGDFPTNSLSARFTKRSGCSLCFTLKCASSETVR